MKMRKEKKNELIAVGKGRNFRIALQDYSQATDQSSSDDTQ
jgi:hypothetical protein